MNDYWKQRGIELENLLQSKTNSTIIEINKLYAQANRIIADKIEKIFSTYKNNGKIHSEYALQLLTARQTAEQRQELLEELSKTTDFEARKKLISILDAPAYANRISRLQALSDYITAQAIKIGNSEQTLFKTRLEDVAKNAYYRSIYNDQHKEGKVYEFEKLSDKRLKAMLAHNWNKKHYSDRIWSNNDRFIKKLQQTVELGCLTGMSLKEMEDCILTDCIGEDSDSGQRFCASRLIRTEVNYFANQGMLLGYEEAGIERYRFLATLDLKTSEICRKLDLKSFPVSEAQAGVNCPPMHPFCRSVTIPDTGSRTGTRWARDPITGKNIKVPADMTYEEWYDKYVKGNSDARIKEKAMKNLDRDKEQYERYKKILGKNAPKTLADFCKIKYNIDEWNAFKAYLNSIKSGELTPLANFKLYKEISGKIDNEIVGLKTSNGMDITGKSNHCIARVIGSAEQRRNGVQVSDVLDALTSNKSKILPIKVSKNGKSQKFRNNTVEVTINPDTGNIIQVNPKHKERKNNDYQ